MSSDLLTLLVRERFTEIITKLVLLLSVSEDLDDTQIWTLASLR